MRITCNTPESFIANLGGQDVYNQTVWIDRSRGPIDGSHSTAWKVSIMASAVLIFPDGGQALLLYGEDCGLDREALPVSAAGTDRQREIANKLESWCESNGLLVRPGALDM